MALEKNDSPKAAPKASDNGTSEAKADMADAAAGSPNSTRQAAEALPERDAVQKAYKKQLTADDTQTEVDAKVTIVEESPDAAETPSGAALLAAQGESDPIEQGEEYTRVKRQVRLGSVEDAD